MNGGGAYYNDNDPKACAWLRELIKDGLIPNGDVDERSIEDVRASDLAGYAQCHFFAGIGGWAYALRLAGWPDVRPVWTGSCPCQPFSCAGKGQGEDDPRHLWPQFRRLIEECRPPVVFGEQVASKAGRGWLSRVRADLEAMGYGVGATDLCAASCGAPHIRQRLYWVAESDGGDSCAEGLQRGGEQRFEPQDGGVGRGMANAERDDRRSDESRRGPEGREAAGRTSPWGNCILIPCADGKARRVEPTIQPLAPRLPGRVGLLRGAGNAIVPQTAQAFIEAYWDVRC